MEIVKIELDLRFLRKDRTNYTTIQANLYVDEQENELLISEK